MGGLVTSARQRAGEKEGMMVQVTARALGMLAEMKASANIGDPDIGLRLEAATSGGLGLLPDRERPGDQIVRHDGEKILLVDDRLSEALTGAQIDCAPVAGNAAGHRAAQRRRSPAETNGTSH